MFSETKKTEEAPRVPATINVTPPAPPQSLPKGVRPSPRPSPSTRFPSQRPGIRPIGPRGPLSSTPRPNVARAAPVPRVPGPSRPRGPVVSAANQPPKPFYRGPRPAMPMRPGVRPPYHRPRLNGPVNGQPRPNGQTPVPEGRTVIGTKTVGGKQHEITMNDAALRSGIRPPVNSTKPRPTASTPPANISVSTKMVGGKEVQLVTPSNLNRRPAVRQIGSSNIRMLNRGPVPARHPRPPVNSQPKTQQPTSMPVKLRRPVQGADKPLATQNQPPKPSLIKLSGKVEKPVQNGDSEPSKENLDEGQNLDGVSELQLTKTLLNTGAPKPKMNEATEKLFEKSKVPKQTLNSKISKSLKDKPGNILIPFS